MAASKTDCKTETGITVGLIDSIIASSNALKGRSLDHPEITEALRDLRSNQINSELHDSPLKKYARYKGGAQK